MAQRIMHFLRTVEEMRINIVILHIIFAYRSGKQCDDDNDIRPVSQYKADYGQEDRCFIASQPVRFS